jgi:hypothetical protein
MNRRAKYFLYFIVLITCVVVFYRYQQYVVNKNFVLKVNTVCDTNTESCFVADCSPENDTECDVTPYKKVEILDAYAPKCLEEHNCPAFSCENSEDKCSVSYCSSDITESGEKCLEIIPS